MKLHRRKERFFQDLTDRTGYDQKQMVAILKENGFETFVESNMPKMRAAILGHVTLKGKIMDKLNSVVLANTEPCPMCKHHGEDGIKIAGKGWPWVCSIYGHHDYVWWHTYETRGHNRYLEIARNGLPKKEENGSGLQEALQEES